MIIRWAGGKKWLPKKFNTYLTLSLITILNLFGWRKFFFNLKETRQGILSDLNPRLIQLFQAIKDDPEKLFSKTRRLINKHSHEHYYKIRERFNKKPEPHLFLYLNRTCFNGVYRENLKGEFNVPIGKPASLFPFEKDIFFEASNKLQKFQLNCCDFEETLKKVKKHDFIYLDPPYVDRYIEEQEISTFRKYNSQIFSSKDLERMASLLNKAHHDMKCRIIASNFSAPIVKKIFKKSDGWKYFEIDKTTFVSGKSKGRQKVKEAVIYKV